MSQAEARNHRIVVLALQEQPQLYRQMVSTGNKAALTVVDCYTDSYGWSR